MAIIKYTQCKLRKKISNGEILLTSYIPSKHAQKGNKVKLKKDILGFESGWVVVEVYPNSECEEKNLPAFHKDIKGHKKQTGDSLQKEKSGIERL